MKRDSKETTNVPGGPGVPGGVILRDKQNPTIMNGDPTKQGPFIHPGVSAPAAIAYAASADARRRQASPPRYTAPVAGGPDVPIPRLDGEASNGTMAEQAVAQRGMPVPRIDTLLDSMKEPALGRPKGGGIVDGQQHLQPPTMSPVRNESIATLPVGVNRDDMLPETATKDPSFMQGPGCMYAANQPHLAQKYGVMRGGKYVNPTQLRGTPKGSVLSEGTVEGLRAIEELQKTRAQAEKGVPTDRDIEEEAAKGPAGGAGTTEKELSDPEKRELLDKLDEFDLQRLKNALFKDMLNNEEQKKIIESRIKELDLSELIVNGRVSQIVPIQPGVFEPEFQSYCGDEDLHVKRLIGEETRQNGGSDRYILDKYQLMGLTIALKAVNKLQLPDYRNSAGDFDEALFWSKYRIVARFNYHMMASLMVNWFWFDMRVRRLFKTDALGNG